MSPNNAQERERERDCLALASLGGLAAEEGSGEEGDKEQTEEENEVSAHKRTGRTPGQEGEGHCLSPRGDMGQARCRSNVFPWPRF